MARAKLSPATVHLVEGLLQDLGVAIATFELDASRRMRAMAGMPPRPEDLEEDAGEASAPIPAAAKPRGGRTAAALPATAAAPTGTKAKPPPRPVGGVPASVAGNPRKAAAYERGREVGAAGGKPVDPYGENPRGAAAWLANAWQEGWAAGSASRKATASA